MEKIATPHSNTRQRRSTGILACAPESPIITSIMESFYRRNLPHWQPESSVIFVTFRVYGSLPREAERRLVELKMHLAAQNTVAGETTAQRRVRHARQLFAFTERVLDDQLLTRHPDRPMWLSDASVAAMICSSLQHHAGTMYALHRFVVMPNHVHVLLEPLRITGSGEQPDSPEDSEQWQLRRIMHGIKSYTASKANRMLGRRGRFWQEESFDHWVRGNEYERIVSYIDMNPVRAGLCKVPEEWPWSSAAMAKNNQLQR